MLDIASRCGDLLHVCVLQFVLTLSLCMHWFLLVLGYYTAEVEVKDQQQIQTETTETKDQHVQGESMALQQGALCLIKNSL